jgi:hypothetical protein
MCRRVVVLIPVYQDWSALILLLHSLDEAIAKTDATFSVLLVDDGSTSPIPEELEKINLSRIDALEILILHRNLGHQRAIAVGLCHIAKEMPCQSVVLMDADGEDDPTDIPRLIDLYEQNQGRFVVFAERKKRSESLAFQLFYHLYRLAHYVLTGIAVRVGNFSVIPSSNLPKLCLVPDLWNHYAASVFKSRLPFTSLATRRAQRLAGRSSMNFTSLVMHGLSAISVFQERVAVRLLIVLMISMGATLLALLVTLAVRLATDLAIPGWATSTAALLIVMLLQMCLLASCFVFFALGGRDGARFLPLRDCPIFVDRKVRIFTREQ